MDQQPSPPSVDVLILSPASLANYANCMERGFMELASGSTITSEHRPSCRSIIAREGDAAAAVALAASQPCGTLLVQLHGAHTEEPVAFMIEAHIRQQQHQQQRPRLVVLLHRPEEILERARRGLYASAASSTDYGGSLLNSLIRHADAVVLLGEAMREVYASLPGCRRCVAIPHGFFGLLSERDLVQSASTAASSDDSPSIVVGSITTWSDMRWVSDILRMHQAYLEARARAPSTLCGGVLFYVAGTYRAYERPDGTRIDELALLQARSSSLALELVDGHEIDALAVERGSGTFSSNELRSWLWQRSGHGARVIVVRSGVRDATALAAQARVCDVNVQLYRELLNDFAPKVEYSGTLHERAGASIPLVFASPSMQDVASEGLAMIHVHWDKPQPTDTNDALNDGSSIFYSERYYPDYRGAVAEILELASTPDRMAEWKAANAAAARELTFAHVAHKYCELIASI